MRTEYFSKYILLIIIFFEFIFGVFFLNYVVIML